MLVRALLGAVLLGTATCVGMYAVAVGDPVVRTATIKMPDWPVGAAPMRVALLTDLHVAGPDMPPRRVAGIVAQVNALKPDLIVFAGDFVSDKRVATRRYAAAEGLAPLAGLKATHGVWAVLGNHDHWRNAKEVTEGLIRAKVRILDNAAVSIGPLRLGGVDDQFTGHADLTSTFAAMNAGPGSKVLLSHSPDVAATTPSNISLILAGHTHCGQIRLPFIGAISYVSEYGDRYACGIIREGPRRVVVSAGLGTSLLPFRLGAAPDLWLLTLTSAGD